MKLVENLSRAELKELEKLAGEAFVTNELFREFGELEDRKDLVMKYMKIYIDCVYEAKALYQSEDGYALIGLAYSDQKAILPQLKMLIRLAFSIPFSTMKRFLKHVKEISSGNIRYADKLHVEVSMVCVSPKHQGRGHARGLVDFAKQMAIKRHVPLLFDTDMKAYAEMYQYMGCELYNEATASNGVTRYNLVWEERAAHR